jgi:cell division transport system ATP-binding protein
MNFNYVVDIKDAIVSQQGIPQIEKIDFNLTEGEITYIIGKSGSGKSSFLKALYADAKIQGKLAKVYNYDLNIISREKIPDLRRQLGMVFQDFRLFEKWTAAYNLSFSLVAMEWKDKAAIRSRVEEVLNDVGLSHHHGTIVGRMSGGEQQRLGIARAMLNKPKIILADEPTGNLDPDTANEIFYLLNRVVNENKTALILATHDYRLINKFPARIFRCENNRLKLEE